MILMKKIIIILFLLLIASQVMASANVDTLKKNIIRNCQEIDSLGRCVIPEEKQKNVIAEGQSFISGISGAISYGLGVEGQDFQEILTIGAIGVIILIGGIAFISVLLRWLGG